MGRGVVVIGIVLMLFATGCGDSDKPEPVARSGSSTAEFCAVSERLVGDVPESYVGSADHLSDLNDLHAVAPTEVSNQLTAYRDYVASGAIDSESDPDSNLIDEWPAM